MNNKEINALLREAESREAMASALKGGAAKEFIKERNALEKSLGGKVKLDKADAVLVDAEKEYARIVTSAKTEANRLVRVANDSIKGKMADIERKSTDLDRMKAETNRQKNQNEQNLRQYDDALEALSVRQGEADKDENVLASREADVLAREMNAAQREAEIKRHNEWLKSAPA